MKEMIIEVIQISTISIGTLCLGVCLNTYLKAKIKNNLENIQAEDARLEAARVEAARVEAARVEAARVEIERVEAARVEAARILGEVEKNTPFLTNPKTLPTHNKILEICIDDLKNLTSQKIDWVIKKIDGFLETASSLPGNEIAGEFERLKTLTLGIKTDLELAKNGSDLIQMNSNLEENVISKAVALLPALKEAEANLSRAATEISSLSDTIMSSVYIIATAHPVKIGIVMLLLPKIITFLSDLNVKPGEK